MIAEKDKALVRAPEGDWTLSGLVVVVFWLLAILIVGMRRESVAWQPGQYTAQDLVSRVSFTYLDPGRLEELRRVSVASQARVYLSTGDPWAELRTRFLQLPALIKGKTPAALPQELRDQLKCTDAQLQALNQVAQGSRWAGITDNIVLPLRPSVLIDARDLDEDRKAGSRYIELRTADGSVQTLPAVQAYRLPLETDLTGKLLDLVTRCGLDPQAQTTVFEFLRANIRPTHAYDDSATQAARRRAFEAIAPDQGQRQISTGEVLCRRGIIDAAAWDRLSAEHDAWLSSLPATSLVRQRLGLALWLLLVCGASTVYTVAYAPRLMTNHWRAAAMALLLLTGLLLAQLGAPAIGQVHFFGTLPSVLVAMVIAVVYDRRLALGLGTMLTVLVAISLQQTLAFFFTCFVGTFLVAMLLEQVRRRAKLILVGFIAGLGMAMAAMASGTFSLDPWPLVIRNALLVFLAAMTSGFVVLGALPVLERLFRITTGLSLLELGDLGHPLLKRLATEAPGTFSHSVQVAMLSETAAEAIGADGLLARVGAYYHDIGKLHRPGAYIENTKGGESAHKTLSAEASAQIITSHVAQGLSLAREYQLPTIVHPFISEHHGTTHVEYFLRQARSARPEGEAIDEAKFTYCGPIPRYRETAIVMLADMCEGASRTLEAADEASLAALVDQCVRQRLLEGQLDDSGLSLGQIKAIRASFVRSLLSVNHARIAYPKPQIKTA